MSEPAPPVLLHRRQFMLGPKPVYPRADWASRELWPGRWLSHCPDLRVAAVEDTPGGARALLGLAVQTREHARDPLTEMAHSSVDELSRLHPSWAGRWLLIHDGRVEPDAGALLGCYFGRTADGVWASSSPALLAAELGDGGSGAVDDRSLKYDSRISWIVPPLTRMRGMSKLLPSQVLHFDGRIEARPLVPLVDESLGAARRLDLLAEGLVTAFRRLPAGTDGPWLSLSAGPDSRVILAAAHRAGARPRPFTRVMPRVGFGDRLIPPKLAARLGYSHQYLRAGGRIPGRVELVRDHSGGHVARGDAEPLIVGVRDGLEGISAGGECFPVANRAFDGARVLEADLKRVGAVAFADAYGEPADSSAVDGLRRWLLWTTCGNDSIDPRDRFAIEQHLAGWQSAKEQIYDMLRVERFFALNSARSYGLLLGLDSADREGSTVQRRLIARLAPELSQEPFNPPDREFGRFRTAAVRSREDPLHVFRRIRARLRR